MGIYADQPLLLSPETEREPWALDPGQAKLERFHAGSNFIATPEKFRFGSIEFFTFFNAIVCRIMQEGKTLLQWWCSIMEHLQDTPFLDALASLKPILFTE